MFAISSSSLDFRGELKKGEHNGRQRKTNGKNNKKTGVK